MNIEASSALASPVLAPKLDIPHRGGPARRASPRFTVTPRRTDGVPESLCAVDTVTVAVMHASGRPGLPARSARFEGTLGRPARLNVNFRMTVHASTQYIPVLASESQAGFLPTRMYDVVCRTYDIV
jgi:hypothetical protein